MAKNISIKELNGIMGDILTGRPVVHGKKVYRLDRLDNGVAWICYKPYENYRSLENDTFPVGWNALLRIA